METGIPCEIIWLESIWLPSSVNLFTKQINLIIPRLYSPKYWTYIIIVDYLKLELCDKFLLNILIKRSLIYSTKDYARAIN